MKSLLFVFALAVLAVGCSEVEKPKTQEEVRKETVDQCPIENLGNNIFRFYCVAGRFGRRLSVFVSDNPELEIVTITGDSNGSSDSGEFVVFRPKK